MYVTPSADWLQESPQFTSFWTTAATQVPFLGPLVAAMTSGGLATPTSNQWSDVLSYLSSHSGYLGDCFMSSLG